jgi:hypothetical protein
MQDLQIKQGELQRKSKKDEADNLFKQQQLKLEEARILAQTQKDKVLGLESAGKLQAERDTTAAKIKLQGLTDLAKLYHEKEKHVTNLEHQENQNSLNREHQTEQKHMDLRHQHAQNSLNRDSQQAAQAEQNKKKEVKNGNKDK